MRVPSVPWTLCEILALIISQLCPRGPFEINLDAGWKPLYDQNIGFATDMKNQLFLILLFGFFLSSGWIFVQAGETGYPSRRPVRVESTIEIDRYITEMPYRHYEDRRRYNAAPYCEPVVMAPYIVKTVVLSKQMEPYHYTDARGRSRCDRVLTVTYQTFYSDGSTQIWVERV